MDDDNFTLEFDVSMSDAASESNAEAWAVGQRHGVDVTSGDQTYHNNAKYYAQQAAGDATATAADRAAVEAAASSIAAAEAAAQAATQAASGAQAAAQSATQAAASAQEMVSHITDGTAQYAAYHLGLYLDADGDLCQVDPT